MGELDRIRWRCRRGLLELDLVLDAFLARGYGRLAAGERALFDELLERREPEARFRAVVEMLRAYSGPAPAGGVGAARAV
jgi:antitoxin CptB